MSNDPSSLCEDDSRFDSDKLYRDRLASEVTAYLGRSKDNDRRRREMEQLIASPLYGDNGADVLSAKDLSEKLRYHPDLQSRLALLTEYSTSKWLLEQELVARGVDLANSGSDAYTAAKDVKTVGVCFSGGGIRSATFNLGILQGLAQLGKLHDIDYLSTVSGGGYIHQFFAAWIKSEERTTQSDGLTSVGEELVPIPELNSNRIIPPEPIRWLRRYSNYLTPSVSIFGGDVWTMIEVWVRNTALNLVILISAIMLALLVPHFALTDIALHMQTPSAFAGRLAIFLILLTIALSASGLLYYSFPRYCAKAEHEEQNLDNVDCLKDRTRIWHPYAITLAWLIVAASTSSIVYRLSIPGGSPYSDKARMDYGPLSTTAFPKSPMTLQLNAAGVFERCVKCESGTSPEVAATRLGRAWVDKPQFALPKFFGRFITGSSQDRVVYRVHGINAYGSPESPLLWLYESLPILFAIFCGVLWRSRKETAGTTASVLSFFCPVLALGFAVGLIFVIENLFFALSFAIRSDYVTALGIALLPSLLLAIPFVVLEFYGGLMGTLYASAQREWIARLRAVSFQIGVLWIVLFFISLIGPHIVQWIERQLVLKYAALATWVVTSITGVLLGQSRSTSGKPKEPGDTGATSHKLQELIVRIAPLVFIVGLLLLVTDLAGWLIAGDHVGQPNEAFARWCPTFVLLLVTCVLFAWRVDINEFSMNSFYRDRLARCYAGASNRERKPNRFTGFDYRDNELRVTSLLPKKWKGLDEKDGTYDGPFPIFCAALNITTGRELAYQERKAASFAITPLYSGYSTGWTDATNSKLQYNGFVPTACHVKKRSGGITTASAVAISGAAASPNMGFHSSAPIAFLMTVFNVRLGWWLRNPRHHTGYDSPVFGLIYLLNELFGRTDDTSRYVYLSDGGHFENMGLHELLRRRCRTIIVCDAEADSQLCFEGFGMAIRKARIDFAIDIRITNVIRAPTPNVVAGPDNIPVQGTEASTGAEALLDIKHFPGNRYHALTGEVRYPEDTSVDPPGRLLYIKSTLTGDEPADILNYHKIHPSFPFDTTLNQFYTESQFESYRALGEHILLKDEVSAWIKANVTHV